MNASTELNAHRLLLMVLRCKNQMDRVALCFGVLRRPDCQDLRDAFEWAMGKGLVQHGTTNASARAWSRGASDELIYLTKAGKAWLRSFGTDFGSGRVQADMLNRARMLAAVAS